MTMLNYESTLGRMLRALPDLKNFHHRHGLTYQMLDEIALEAADSIFGESGPQVLVLEDLGALKLPFLSMGEIKSTHLFGLDELIIFSFYLKNKNRYKKVFDIGANIGLHSIILAKAGFDVVSYEPDPWHFKILQDNLELNSVASKVSPRNKAVSTSFGELEFIRVLDNTTGSHLAGAKKDPYGELERFNVSVDAFKDIMKGADLLKIDVEGHESKLILSSERSDWVGTDAIVEIGTPENAKLIFEYMKNVGVNLYSQKKSWLKVNSLEDMPASYKEGSLFISLDSSMPW
jgi:FkbM family methyltransferase